MAVYDDDLDTTDLVRVSASIVAAYVGQNHVPQSGIPDLIAMVHSAFVGLEMDETPQIVAVERKKPAVPVSRSVQQDYIVCLEDGARLKMLKRYIRSRFNLSPDEYRRKWGLPADYPMVAPTYAATRSALAKKIGLGRGSKSA